MSSINNYQDSNNHAQNLNNDVGIVNMEVYFPSQYVDQTDLETFDNVSSGKYTIGLGQKKMGFCSDIEDVNSLCLTVVSRLVSKSGINYNDIGRIEVGTETLIDKSKSVKTVLMQLFEESGNTDVEGVHSTNACYGGTAALFNCISWFVESSSYDGRYAIAVCADIAVYAKGSARPTGGAGAVAMLIGKNPALVLDRGLRASHAEDVYDFYKPNMSSEYPVVDGPLSIKCYLKSLDICYQRYCQKASKKSGKHTDLNNFDAILFHAPYCKLVMKSFGRLILNDYVRLSETEKLEKFAGLEKFQNIRLEDTYFDKEVEKTFMKFGNEMFESKTSPSLLMARNVGNMYTPSLYGGLVSFLCSMSKEELAGKKVGLFSYGSGLVASFYSLRVSEDTEFGSPLDKLSTSLSDVHLRLDTRTKFSAEDFDKIMQHRETTHHLAPYTPIGKPESLFNGTYYLKNIDEKHRRTYSKWKSVQNGH